MWPKSLSARLILTLFAWSLLALLVTGVILVTAYRRSIEQRFDDTLNIYLKSIVADLADVEIVDRFDAGPDLREPRFDFPLSGWYWQITDHDSNVVLSSASLVGETLVLPTSFEQLAAGDISGGVVDGPNGTALRFVARLIQFEETPAYIVTVAADPVAVRADTARFTRTVVLFLSLSALGLLVAGLVQVRIVLQPLGRLRRQLKAIHSGQRPRLDDNFPHELAPLTRDLNRLIDSNRGVLDRARQHVGNLAHALKTPLSILLNESRGDPSALARSVEDQATQMQRQVRHHLERARIAAKRRLIGAVTDVSPVIARLARVIERLSGDSNLKVQIRDPGGFRFAGEQQDLEEMVGNLLDNARKWATSTIRVAVEPLPGNNTRPMFVIEVADDGPGLDAKACRKALSRGARIDETKPGSGLGLSIVSELVTLYGGHISLDRSPMGGLRARLQLPLLPT